MLAQKLNRRDFLAVTATAAVSAATSPAWAAPAPVDAEWRNKQDNMTYRRLGRTGFMVSSIGMGGDDIRPNNIDQVLWSVDRGLNYFDTAPNYGNGLSEKGYAAVHKARGRDRVFQCTKVNIFPNRTRVWSDIFNSLPATEQAELRKRVADDIERKGIEDPDYIGPYFTGQQQGLRAAAAANILAEKYSDKVDRQKEYKQYIVDSVEKSLVSLATDHLDCVLMRGIETPYEISHTPEVFEAFEILKKQGKARFLGFTAHTDPAGVLDAAIDTGQYSMGMIAYHFLNHKRVNPVLEKAKKADFGVMCMKAARVIQNPFNRRQTIPERVKAIDALVPGDASPFLKAFGYALQNENLSGVVMGISDMDQAQQDLPLAFAKKA